MIAGDCQYGDRLEGGKEGADGEVRGGEIVGNVMRQKLVAGDVASAPAGIPHFWEVEPGKMVTYSVSQGPAHWPARMAVPEWSTRC